MMKIDIDKKGIVVILALAALIMSVVVVHGCGVSSYVAPADTTTGTITITRAGVIQVGNAPVQLTATLADGTNVTTQVTWSSDNPDFASVDSTGLVTAHMAGHATITATMGGQTGTLAIIVFAAAGH